MARRATAVAQRGERLAKRVQRLRPYRVMVLYNLRNGNLLSSGMSYQSVFAIFAAIWVGFALAGLWLRANGNVFDSLVSVIDDAVPGLVGSDGVLSQHELQTIGTTLSLTGIFAAVSLLWTAIGWLSSTRLAVRAMFDLPHDPRNFFLQKVRDLGLAFAFGLVLVISSLVSLASTQLLELVLGWFGVGPHSSWYDLASRLAGLAVVFLLNFVVVASMYRVLSNVLIPLRNLLVAAAIAAAALGVLSVASAIVLHGASKNPLLASFTVFVGLLIWFNLVCKVILFGAAWIAVGMSDRGLSPRRISVEEQEAERAAAAYRARLLQAQMDVASASAAYDSAHGIRRRIARGTLFRAYQRLRAVRAEGTDRSPTPKL